MLIWALGRWKFRVWVQWYMFLGQISSRTLKMATRHFSTAQIGRNLKIGQIQKSQESVWKVTIFDFQKTKLGHFKDIYLKFCTDIRQTGFLQIYFGFWKFENVPWKLWKMIFCIFIFQSFRFFLHVKNKKNIRLIYAFILKPLLKTNRLYFYSCLRESFPQTLISNQSRENMRSLWRHLRPTCQC